MFTVMDTADRPLRAALSCRHLTVGSDAHRAGRFYPRCGLGDSDDRARWVATVTPARLAVMRTLEEEFNDATLAERTELLTAKAQLLSGEPDAAAVEDLEVRVSAFLDRVDAFIDERAERLADVGLPTEDVQEVLAAWSIAWLRSRDVYGPGSDVLQRAGIGANAAALLGAELAEPAAASLTAEATVTSSAGALVMTRTEDPRRLCLRGEVDAVTADALATALADALADGGSITIDFTEVLFCDLGGLRALVLASQSAAPGQRIDVVGLPEHLHRAARLVGWDELPGLVIAPPATGDWRWRWRA